MIKDYAEVMAGVHLKLVLLTDCLEQRKLTQAKLTALEIETGMLQIRLWIDNKEKDNVR